jgi:hypothetical protein
VAEVIGISNEICKDKYEKDKITDKMLCAYKEGIDTCRGDSGGKKISLVANKNTCSAILRLGLIILIEMSSKIM